MKKTWINIKMSSHGKTLEIKYNKYELIEDYNHFRTYNAHTIKEYLRHVLFYYFHKYHHLKGSYTLMTAERLRYGGIEF